MAQENVFGDLLPSAGPAPTQAPGVIYGRPRQKDPQEAALKGIQIQKGQADLTDRNMPTLSTGYRWKNGVVGGDQEPIPGGPADVEARKAKNDSDKIGVEQGKAGGFYLRASRSNDAYNARGIGAESLGLAGARAVLPDAITNQFVDPDRQQAEARMRDFIAATLRYESGAAIPPEEFESQAKTFFPQPGDGPAVIKEKEKLRANAIEALKLSAGSVAGQVDGDGARSLDRIMQADPTRDFAADDTAPPRPAGEPVFGDDPRAEQPQAYRMAPEKEAAYQAFIVSQRGNPNVSLATVNQFLTALGEQPIPDDERGQQFIANIRSGTVDPSTMDYSLNDADYQARLDAEIKEREKVPGSNVGGRDLVVQGGTFGLSDEIVGGASSIARALTGQGGDYGFERDLYRRQLDQTRGRMGAAGTAAEVGGALLTGNPNALMAIAPQGARAALASGARLGAGTGALAGFGYGEGAQDSATNALIGAGIGGGIGAVVSAAGPGVNALRARLPQRAPADLGFTGPSGAPANAADVAAAGRAEGVTVNRAMVDPASRNRVTGVETTMAGGPIVQRNMGNVTREIEGRLDDLGRGGTPMQDNVAGQTIEGASRRFIERSGKAVGRMYDRAVQQSRGVDITPTQATTAVDDALSRLSQTPNTNSAEIAYLQGLKGDLSRPLGVETLRDLRTTLRSRISKGELVFGQNEARVLGVMDDLSADIESGLRAAGRGRAADLFRRADNLYRQRAQFIETGVQKLIGKRSANLPPERVMANLRAMASPKGDEANLARVMQTMTPDERADIAATFADAIGKNNNGEFTVAQFAAQAEKLPVAARRHIFGDEGAESINNLITLSKAVKAVPSNTSRTGAANDYRAWILNALVGGGAGVATSSGATGVGIAVGGAGLKMGRDILTARSLMSPKITRWIRQTPRTADSRAIDSHFKKLSGIAAQEPAMAGEIQAIQQRLLEAARGGVLRPVAAEDIDQGRAEQPGQ